MLRHSATGTLPSRWAKSSQILPRSGEYKAPLLALPGNSRETNLCQQRQLGGSFLRWGGALQFPSDLPSSRKSAHYSRHPVHLFLLHGPELAPPAQAIPATPGRSPLFPDKYSQARFREASHTSRNYICPGCLCKMGEKASPALWGNCCTSPTCNPPASAGRRRAAPTAVNRGPKWQAVDRFARPRRFNARIH